MGPNESVVSVWNYNYRSRPPGISTPACTRQILKNSHHRWKIHTKNANIFIFHWIQSLMGILINGRYSDVKWPRYFNSPVSQLFVRLFAKVDVKGNTKAPHKCPFVKGMHRWPVNSPHKGPVMRKVFLFHDAIMGYGLPGWLEESLCPMRCCGIIKAIPPFCFRNKQLWCCNIVSFDYKVQQRDISHFVTIGRLIGRFTLVERWAF